MTRIPAPATLSRTIAEKAVRYAREDIKNRGWKSSGALQPTYAAGQVGIRTTLKYLMYQNRGISPFLMHWVEGRTVPLGCKQGDGPHMRRGKGVGLPGYVDIPHKGRVFRNQKWRHPGLAPKYFMEIAVHKAIADSRSDTKAALITALRGEPQ